jgi:hypothetical protein
MSINNRIPPVPSAASLTPGIIGIIAANAGRRPKPELKAEAGSQPANANPVPDEVLLTRPSLPFEGEIRGIQRAGIFRTFRLQSYDRDGNPQPAIQVEIQGSIFAAPAISEGDRIEILSGKWRKTGTLRARRIHNLTTGKGVKTAFNYFPKDPKKCK